MRRLLVAIALLAVGSTAAMAQTCVGAASFRSGPIRIGAGMNVGDGARSYGAEIGAGLATGLFGSAAVSRQEFEDLANAALGLSLEAGYALELNPAGTIQFCPSASFGYVDGPDIETDAGTATITSHGFVFGGAFGGQVAMSPALDFVPFVSGGYVSQRTSANLSAIATTLFESNGYGEIDVGAGFVVNRVLTLRPSVSVPIGLEGGKTSFSFAFSYNLGEGAGVAASRGGGAGAGR